MPLQNHFIPPLSITHPWQGFHSAWATTIAQQLNQGVLPERYYAIPNVQLGGPIEIDVATLQDDAQTGTGSVAAEPVAWSPPAATVTVPVDFTHLDRIEVQVLYDEGGPRLMAAIELVSPANKDRPSSRRAFAVKCANYLQQGIAVVLVDVVTDRRANLHAELLGILELHNGAFWESPSQLYAVAYRPVRMDGQSRLELWPHALALRTSLPQLPLWLAVDFSVPLDLESSYVATCVSLRLRA